MRRKNKKRVMFFGIYAIMFLAICLTIPFISSCASENEGESSNKFYDKHIEELMLCNRSFTSNGGFLLTKPGGSEIEEIPAGKILFVKRYYTDRKDVVWGYVDYPTAGWVAMDELVLVYDEIAFRESHSEEISDTGDSLPEGLKYIWSYPGSGIIIGRDYSSPDEEEAPSLFQKYTDPEGRVWASLDTEGWICLSAPDDNNIAALDYPPASMTYYKPPAAPSYWDTAPPYAPYVWAGIALIIIIEAAIQMNSYVKRNKK